VKYQPVETSTKQHIENFNDMPNSSTVRPQNTLYFLKEKCKDLPRNQPNGNHIVVLHEACLCTEFPLHKMCANKYKKQITLYVVIGVMTTCADPFLSLELGNWLVHTFWIASFGPGSNSKILHKPSTYPTECWICSHPIFLYYWLFNQTI
jgi:hypothetical protein